MTAPQLASEAPQNDALDRVASDRVAKDRPYTFHLVPLLRELLPKQQGRPGLIYAQVYVANERRAQDQGWNRIEGTVIYTIVGPKGHADMVLMGKGKPISGVGHASGKRRCVIDIDVERLTGHAVKSVPLNTAPTNGSAGKKGS